MCASLFTIFFLSLFHFVDWWLWKYKRITVLGVFVCGCVYFMSHFQWYYSDSTGAAHTHTKWFTMFFIFTLQKTLFTTIGTQYSTRSIHSLLFWPKQFYLRYHSVGWVSALAFSFSFPFLVSLLFKLVFFLLLCPSIREFHTHPTISYCIHITRSLTHSLCNRNLQCNLYKIILPTILTHIISQW